MNLFKGRFKMPQTVGIPRGLLFYNYFPLWETFFEELGCRVIISEKTTKDILNSGIEVTVDDACLPIKIYHGHIRHLVNQNVDYIYVPRLVSVFRKEYICPKFSGLPDMIKSNVKNLPRIISPDIDWSNGKVKLMNTVLSIGKIFSRDPLKVWLAYKKGYRQYKQYKSFLQQGFLPEEAVDIIRNKTSANDVIQGKQKKREYKVLLLGHPYNLYDSFINMDIIHKLTKMGCAVLTPELLSGEIIENYNKNLPKKIFWTMEKRLVGNTLYYLEEKKIDGIIYLVSFGCGPDSLVGELVGRWVKKKGRIPFMLITIDEHTGEAGFNTRLEAFVDMIERCKV